MARHEDNDSVQPPPRPMVGEMSAAMLWLRWVLANGVGECLGLGAVAAVAWVLFHQLPAALSVGQELMVAGSMVLLGGLEGAIVGHLQFRVLRRLWPALSGWVIATVQGAVFAWVLGMLPSTIMSVSGAGADSGGAPPQLTEVQRLGLAAGLGAVAGPVLAWLQSRRLRLVLPPRQARQWLPAHALAWAAGMPIIFAGAHQAAGASPGWGGIFAIAVHLFASGAVVGAIHGAWLLHWRRRACQAASSRSVTT